VTSTLPTIARSARWEYGSTFYEGAEERRRHDADDVRAHEHRRVPLVRTRGLTFLQAEPPPEGSASRTIGAQAYTHAMKGDL
jgi:hypothetical protein